MLLTYCASSFVLEWSGGSRGLLWGCGPSLVGPRWECRFGGTCLEGACATAGSELYVDTWAQPDGVRGELDVRDTGPRATPRRDCLTVEGTENLEVGAVLLTPATTSEVDFLGSCNRPCRYSIHLVGGDTTPILDKAVARKARLQDVGCIEGGRRALSKMQKIQHRSSACGVLLNERGANSFLEFASHKF